MFTLDADLVRLHLLGSAFVVGEPVLGQLHHATHLKDNIGVYTPCMRQVREIWSRRMSEREGMLV